MNPLRVLWHRCTAFFAGEKHNHELDEELQQHILLATDENLQRGMSPLAARRAALLQFGGVTQVTETYRMQRGLPLLNELLQDIRFGWRQLKRAPGFAVIAILTLTMGIGANTAVFTLTHALLLSTLPIPKPGALVRLAIDMNAEQSDSHDVPLSLPMIEEIQRQSHTLQDVFAWCVYDFPFRDGTVDGGIHGALVSGNAFDALGLEPAAGRLLLPADDQPGGGPDGIAAVISHRIWLTRYNADPSVIGRHVVVTDHPVTIVGVAPEGFEGVIAAEHPDIYLPLEFQATLFGEPSKHDGALLWLDTFARLKPASSRQQGAAEMSAIFPAIRTATLPPALRNRPWVLNSSLAVKPASTGWSKLRATYTQPLVLLQVMVAAVLLICCANLSGLFLARGSARRQEFAIRGALGASRLRLIRQLLVESLMLATPGAILGVALAWAAGPSILHMLGNAEAEQAISMRPNPAVLWMTVACAVSCALIFGAAPALSASRTSADQALRTSDSRTTLAGAGLRNLFVPFQVALSLVLIVVAALLGSTVTRLLTENSGYHTQGVVFALTDFLRVPQKGDALVSLYHRMAQQIESQPGVEQASVSAASPFLNSQWNGDFVAADGSQNAKPVTAMENIITAHYFSALGIPLLTGRDLADTDADRTSCVLSLAAARLYFPGTTALGKTLRAVIHRPRTGEPDAFHDFQIVGIAQDTRYTSLRESPPPIVYLPLAAGDEGQTNAGSNLYFVIHARDVAAANAAYTATLHAMAPSSPEIPPAIFTQLLRDSVSKERLLSVLSGFFALLGLLLSGIGIYGLVTWNVTRRTGEIGVRMALGATRPKVFLLVMRQVAVSLAAGILIGALGAAIAAHAIRSYLFEVQPGNPWVFVFSTLTLVLIGLLAAAAPARRAISIDPMQALRSN